MRHAKRWAEGRLGRADDPAGERGSASLEFITAGLILLVPLVYLVVAMSGLQGGSLAVEGAARQAARVYVQAPDEATARARADRAVQFALADHGLNSSEARVSIECTVPATGCLSRQNAVTVTVSFRVPLPLVPDALFVPGATSIPVQATATQLVSRFWAAP